MLKSLRFVPSPSQAKHIEDEHPRENYNSDESEDDEPPVKQEAAAPPAPVSVAPPVPVAAASLVPKLPEVAMPPMPVPVPEPEIRYSYRRLRSLPVSDQTQQYRNNLAETFASEMPNFGLVDRCLIFTLHVGVNISNFMKDDH